MSGIIIRVTLEGSRPEVWRKLLLPERISLSDLHEVLRVVFGWTGRRTHEYYCDSESIGYLELEDESRVALDAFGQACLGLCYIYDFRDDWRHMIQVEGADPAWKARFAKVLEYQGDNFVEGIGGVERVDAPDYDPAKERIPFELTEVNRGLKGRTFPRCTGSDTEDKIRAITAGAGSNGEKHGETDRESYGAALDGEGDSRQKYLKEKQQGNFEGNHRASVTEKAEKNQETPAAGDIEKNRKTLPMENSETAQMRPSSESGETVRKRSVTKNSEKQRMRMVTEDPKKNAPYQVSPLQQSIDLWETACYEEATIAKNISRKSPTELLTGMGEKREKEYIKFLGISEDEIQRASSAAEAIWKCLEAHPAYLAYLLEWEKMEKLLKFSKLRNSICSKMPDQEAICQALSLGLLDLSIERVNRSTYLTLRQTKEMGRLLASYTDDQWKSLCDEAEKAEERCMRLLGIYGLMELDAFCEKYQEFYGCDMESETIKRIIYLCGRTKGHIVTGTMPDGQATLCLRGLEEIEITAEEYGDFRNLDYQEFTAEEREGAARDGWMVWPSMQRYYDFCQDNYEIDEGQLKDFIYRQYILALTGAGMDMLWGAAEKTFRMSALDFRVSFWMILMDIYVNIGLPKYKGHSRTEYALMKDCHMTEICGKFSRLDYEGEKRPIRRIKEDTHLCEFPEDMQLDIFGNLLIGGEEGVHYIREIQKNLEAENAELTWAQIGLLFQIRDYSTAEKYLRKLKERYPADEKVKSYLHSAQKELKRQLQKENGQKNFVGLAAMPLSNGERGATQCIVIDGVSIPVGRNGFEEESSSRSDFDEGENTTDAWDGIPAGTTYRRMQPKVGRNDPCPCGSGKKYKKCCGR